MPKRRANGEGNIRKRKDGRWEGRCTADYDPESGKRIIKNVLGKTQVYAFLRCFRPGFSVRGSRRGSTGDFRSPRHTSHPNMTSRPESLTVPVLSRFAKWPCNPPVAVLYFHRN